MTSKQTGGSTPRRPLHKGASIVAAGGAQDDSRLLKLRIERQAALVRIDQHGRGGDDVDDLVDNLLMPIDEQIVACRATTVQGLAVKMDLLNEVHCGEEDTIDGRMWGSLARDIEPMAGGAV